MQGEAKDQWTRAPTELVDFLMYAYSQAHGRHDTYQSDVRTIGGRRSFIEIAMPVGQTAPQLVDAVTGERRFMWEVDLPHHDGALPTAPGTSMTMTTTSTMSVCAVCAMPAQFLCEGCERVTYCSVHCQGAHWIAAVDAHSMECGPLFGRLRRGSSSVPANIPAQFHRSYLVAASAIKDREPKTVLLKAIERTSDLSEPYELRQARIMKWAEEEQRKQRAVHHEEWSLERIAGSSKERRVSWSDAQWIKYLAANRSASNEYYEPISADTRITTATALARDISSGRSTGAFTFQLQGDPLPSTTPTRLEYSTKRASTMTTTDQEIVRFELVSETAGKPVMWISTSHDA